jgi:hypothetical protein
MRTLVDIPSPAIAALDALGRTRGASRAKLIREAVVAYLGHQAPVPRADAFGLWSRDEEDGLAYQRRLRAEW